jgi:dihydrofolate reductase
MASTTVVGEITISIDGFVTGPDPDLDHGLGRGGEPLHQWVFGDDPVDQAVLQRSVDRSGAVIMGRRLFDIIDGPNGWSDDVGYGAEHAAQPPVFVVTHEPPASWRLGDRFRFVTGGVGAAVDAAREVVDGKDVVVMGGGHVIRQALDEGLLDELVLHVSPMLLGRGTPLFDDAQPRALEQVTVEVSSEATHLTYRVPPATSP